MVPYEFSAERFSRWMAYVLRHNPERYGLTPDRHGYVELEGLLRIAARRYPEMDAERLRELIAASDRARLEVAGGLVRARYGHSIPAEPVGPPVEPPAMLYHGTEESRLAAILAGGLQPVDRRMVHLSVTAEDAFLVAQRKAERSAVVRVRAHEAHQAGILFYREHDLYLASHIPAAHLSQEPLPASPASQESEPPEGSSTRL